MGATQSGRWYENKLLSNWRRRLVLCVQQGGDVFEHLA